VRIDAVDTGVVVRPVVARSECHRASLFISDGTS
jgi:hypothetical protein